MSNTLSQNENENPTSRRSRQPITTVKDTIVNQENTMARHPLNGVPSHNTQNIQSENHMQSYNAQKRKQNEEISQPPTKRQAPSSGYMGEANLQVLSDLDELEVQETPAYQPAVLSIQDKVGYLAGRERFYIPHTVFPSRQTPQALGLRQDEFDQLAFQSLLAEGITPLGYNPNDNLPSNPLEPIDSYEYDLETENKKKILDYLPNQPDLTARMREILIDWLHEVCSKFNLRSETIILCVSIIDRALCRRVVSRTTLQLLGATAIYIASKYEELYPPDISEIIGIVDSSFSKEKIVCMEELVLKDLDFKITYPYPTRFFDRALRVAHAFYWGPSFAYDKASAHPGSIYMSSVAHLASTSSATYNAASRCGYYLCHLSLQFYQFVYYKPSQIACAALAISLKITGRACWTSKLQSYIGVDLNAMMDVIREFARVIPNTDSKYRYTCVKRRFNIQNEPNIPNYLIEFFSNTDSVITMLQEIENLAP